MYPCMKDQFVTRQTSSESGVSVHTRSTADLGRADVSTHPLHFYKSSLETEAPSFGDTTCQRAADASSFLHDPDNPNVRHPVTKLKTRPVVKQNRTTALLSSEEKTYPMPNS